MKNQMISSGLLSIPTARYESLILTDQRGTTDVTCLTLGISGGSSELVVFPQPVSGVKKIGISANLCIWWFSLDQPKPARGIAQAPAYVSLFKMARVPQVALATSHYTEKISRIFL
jgi:hypothetical protein